MLGKRRANIRKLVRHRCGQPLWAETSFLEAVEDEMCVSVPAKAVVNYRSASPGAAEVLVWVCPGCGKPLRIWWDVQE